MCVCVIAPRMELADEFKSEYDKSGDEVKSTYYDENGVMNGYDETEYNADERRVKRTLYDSDGVCTDYIVYEHDSEGNEIGGTCYNADGSINNSYKWDNSDGPIVETVPEELTE